MKEIEKILHEKYYCQKKSILKGDLLTFEMTI